MSDESWIAKNSIELFILIGGATVSVFSYISHAIADRKVTRAKQEIASDISKGFESVNVKLDDVQEDITIIGKDIATHTQEIKGLDGKINGHKEDITKLYGKSEKLSNKVAALEATQ